MMDDAVLAGDKLLAALAGTVPRLYRNGSFLRILLRVRFIAEARSTEFR